MKPDIPVLESADEEVRRQAMASMPDEIQLLDDVLLQINSGVAQTTGQSNDRGLNFLSVLLLNRAFNSLWRARHDAVIGYPVQSLILARAAMEDWGTLYYVERHPETHFLWLNGLLPEVSTDQRPPRFTDIWNDLGEHLGTDLPREVYGHLSTIAHPRGGGLPWLFHLEGDQTHLHVGSHFAQRDLSACLYFSVSIGQMLFQRVGTLQERVLGAVDSEWLQRTLELSDSVQMFIDRMHAEHSQGRVQLDEA